MRGKKVYDAQTTPATYRKLRLLFVCTDAQAAKFFGVRHEVFRFWLSRYPALKEVKEETALADAAVAEALYVRAVGFSRMEQVVVDGEMREIERYYAPDTKAAIHWLTVRQPHWRHHVSREFDERLASLERALGLTVQENVRLPHIVEQDKEYVNGHER